MRAVGYIRVSTDKQARDGESLAAQKARIEAYCEAYCEENGFTLLKVYHDKESGGKSKARGGYMELLDRIKENGFDVLVVNDTDRLSRDSMSLLILEYILRQAGIEFHGVTGRINTDNPDGFMMFGIKSLVGESERRRISRKTTEVLQHKRQSGLAASRPPYGTCIGKQSENSLDLHR
jgi:DNA invertase Pin-like site-specific DNA recombinase